MTDWNVLLVTFDQWRGDYLSSAGHPVLETPHIDSLAAEGVLFRRHFAQAVPCGPSRASLWTGMYLQNHRSGTNGTPLDYRFTNLALEARNLGYNPALFGYTDTTHDPRNHVNTDPILENYEQALPGMQHMLPIGTDISYWLNDLARKGYDVPDRPEDIWLHQNDRADAEGREFSYGPTLYKAEDSDSRYLTDQVENYLRTRRGRPWFVHASYLRPHPPFIVPEPYHNRYDPVEMPAPIRAENVAREGEIHPYLEHQLRTTSGTWWCEGVDRRPSELTNTEVAQLRATYCGMVNEVEDNFQRLVDYLKKTGEIDRTLIILTSDHGEYLGDHHLLGKNGWFDQAYHIPMIIRDPRREADGSRGRVVEAFSENIDVMPTVLTWLGAKVPRQCDGRSVLPWLYGETPSDWRQEAHFEFDFRSILHLTAEQDLGLRSDECVMNMQRGERYKYVHFTSLPPLLFDMEKDPGELVNRIEDPDYREIALACAQKMLSWRMSNDDRVLANVFVQNGPHELDDDRRGYQKGVFPDF